MRIVITLLTAALWSIPAFGQARWPASKVVYSNGDTVEGEKNVHKDYAISALPVCDGDLRGHTTYINDSLAGTDCATAGGTTWVLCVCNDVPAWAMVGGGGGGGGVDATAIHKATPSEISAITEKAAPVAADLVLIEDSEATNAKKRAQIGNLTAAIGAAPDDVDYLVGTASGSLSAEIAVGTTPGGDLTGTDPAGDPSSWASPQVGDFSHFHYLSEIGVHSFTDATSAPCTDLYSIPIPAAWGGPGGIQTSGSPDTFCDHTAFAEAHRSSVIFNLGTDSYGSNHQIKYVANPTGTSGTLPYFWQTFVPTGNTGNAEGVRFEYDVEEAGSWITNRRQGGSLHDAGLHVAVTPSTAGHQYTHVLNTENQNNAVATLVGIGHKVTKKDGSTLVGLDMADAKIVDALAIGSNNVTTQCADVWDSPVPIALAGPGGAQTACVSSPYSCPDNYCDDGSEVTWANSTETFADTDFEAVFNGASVDNADAQHSHAFNAVTDGTNTSAAMVVGSGASLGVSGSGTIAATSGDALASFFPAATSADLAGILSDESGTAGGFCRVGTGAGTGCTLNGATLTIPTINPASWANANHTHAGSTSGGNLGTDIFASVVRSMYWGAGAISTDGTNCSTAIESAINSGPKQFYITCTDNAGSYLYGSTVMPDSWDATNVNFEISAVNLNAAPSGTHKVAFDAQCSRGGLDTISSTWGTPVTATITFDTQYRVESATTGQVTPAGTCAAGALLMWRGLVNTGTTTQESDIRHIGVKMEHSGGIDDL